MAVAGERTRTPTEEIVAGIWASELRLPTVGLDDDFIDLGSHSLQGAAIVARLEDHFGVAIPVRTLFEEPTVADLAAWIDRRGSAPTAAEFVCLQPGAAMPPLFVLPGGRADARQLFGIAKLAHELGPDLPVYAFPGDPPVTPGTPPAAWVGAAATTLVAAVRAVQPREPYALLGVCVGGLFAWEMARQLELEAGPQQVHLFLYDTRHPSLRLPERTFRHAVAEALSPAERRTRHCARRAWRRQHAPRATDGAGARRITMAHAYDPGPFAGQVDLLVNREWHRVSPDLGWDGLLGDRLRVAVAGHGHGPEWDVAGVATWLREGLGDVERGWASTPAPRELPSPNGHAPGDERVPRTPSLTPAGDAGQGTLIDALRGWAARTPEAPALLWPGRTAGDPAGALDYRGLSDEVAQLAASLRRLGIQPDDRVALALPDGPALATMLLAVMTAGIASPLAWGMTRDEFGRALPGARAMVVPAGAVTPARDAAATLGLPVFELEVDSVGAAGERFRLSGPPLGSPAAARAPRPEQVALTVYTSGTCGRPKPIPRTHGNIAATTLAVLDAMAITPADRCLNLAPMTFSQGANALFTTIWAGASLVALPSLDLAALPGWVERFAPTWFSAAPTTLRALAAEEPAAAALRAGRLRMVRASAGALVSDEVETLEAALGTRVLHSYGMSEASFIAGERFRDYQRQPGSVGLPQCEVAIVGPAGEPVAAGESGEIVVRGANVFPGYLDDAAANAAAFRPAGWLRTGDVGHLDAAGHLYVTGRLKEIIKRAGQAISPLEIEDALLAAPAVAEACVFAVPHPELGEAVAAAVVVQAGALTTERALREWVAARLSPQKAPAVIAFVAAIPRGPTGKPLRRALSAALAAPHPVVAQPDEPRSDPRVIGLTEDVIRLCTAILGPPAIGADDDLLALGVDSMQLARIAAALQKVFAVDLAPGVLFARRTPARLAAWLAAAMPDASEAAPPPAVPCPPSSPIVFVLEQDGPKRFLGPSRLMAGADPERPFQELVMRPSDVGEAATAGEQARRAARRCAAAVRAEHSGGPYLVVGIGACAPIAIELAELLRADGHSCRVLLFQPATADPADGDGLPSDELRVARLDLEQRPRQVQDAAAQILRDWLAGAPRPR